MKEFLRRIKSLAQGKVTGYDMKIIINIGINARNKKDALEQTEEVAKEFKAKFHSYLSQYPYWITIE